MADTLESLEIKVQHNASGADAEINGVATAIGRLKTALTGVPAALKELASAVKAVNDAFKGGTAKYDKFAESMLNVATSAELLGENSSHVMTLANAMNTLTSVKVTAGSFNALAKGVEGVGTAAQTITPEAISNLDKMVTSLAKLQGVDLQGLGSAMSAVNRGGRSATPGTATPLPAEMQEMISTASAIDVLEAKLASLHVAMQEAFNSGDVDKALNLRNQILQTEASLEKARAAAEKAGKATQEAGKGIKEMSKEASKAQKPLGNFVSSLKRIAFYRAIRTVIKAITQAFSEGLQNAYAFSQGIATEGHRFAQALDSMATAGLTMKNQLGSAFIGLLTALTPIINALIGLVTRIADAMSQFFAIFTGGTYLKAQTVPKTWADNANSAAKAAKEWKNQLLGFDEINRLEEPNNGGGGGKINDVDPSLMFEDAEIDERIQRIAEKIKALAASFKITFRDVFFDWSNLTGEQIAEKIIAGLGSLVGAGVGFIIGGVPGAVVGTIIGATAGIEFASLIFDHDGVISKEEIGEMLRAALFGLTGGVIGFTVGGVRGALLGASIGVSLDTILTTLTFTDAISENVLSSLSDVLGAGAGAIIGFKLGGPLGAVFGATIGLGLSIGIESFLIEDTSNWGVGDWIAHVVAALLPVAGTAIGLALGGPGGATIGAVIGAGLSLTLKNILIEDKSNWGAGDWIANVVAPLLPVAGAAVGLALAGPLGAAVGMGIGVDLSMGIKSILMADKTNWGTAEWVSNLVAALAPIAGAAIGFMVGGPFGAAIGAVIGIGIKFAIRGIDWGSVNAAIENNVRAMEADGSIYLQGFASGGFPGDSGQLFVAREQGPEMVGTIGGHTAVANNDQIVEGIRAGVYEAVSAAMSNGGNGDVSLKVYLDSREIKAGFQRLDRAWGA